MKRRISLLTATVLALLLLLSACSGGTSSGGASSAGTNPSSAGTASAPPAAEVRKINVVGYTGNKPFVYLDENGVLQGYEPEVLRKIDELLPQYEFTYDGMDFSAMPVALESGSAQIAVCMLVKSEERLEKFIFPEHASTLAPMHFVLKEGRTDIQTFDDFAGNVLVSGNSGYEYIYVVKWNEKHADKPIIFDFYTEANFNDTYDRIAKGEVDGVLTYAESFQYAVSELGITGVELSPVVFVEDTYFMIAQKETELRDAIDGALEQLQNDGTLSALATEYLGRDVFTEFGDLFTAQGQWQQ
ncbi:MAG: transporter substrate-binding domain-containing protein [Oscillospiraceae bacterium]|jgi:L-cystine transport system substrate-binding protein|nr:transporter substrate-binding domain-containing protein [Oscillospiraceae bacterium]